ncbi:hypothetical protein K3495_g11929 [Podosphaera aphanis]|nr:hypothetical protein K3495_g11929 [Podosphaera aphanis]
MAKDKKGKSDGKKAKIAEKKKKQEQKGNKKEKAKSSKVDDSDAEDIDLEAVLASYAKQQEQFLKVTEVVCEPPSARSSATLIASPANDNELFLFGGENFNGALATFFNDLYVYLISKDEWRLVTSPNTPLPRSGHAWCQSTNSKEIYLFGGEFSSPKQGTFYHYNDFWAFEPSTREWTRLETKGKSPPARSGHRMTCYKKYIILFGGFQDTSQNTKYLADLWIYDTQQFLWHNPVLPLATQKPEARSSFSFLPHNSGAVLYGGYSRIKTTIVKKQNKGNVQKNVLKPMIHQDCFLLRLTPPSDSAAHNAPPTVRWERRKKPTNVPNPARAGATMAFHKGRGILFGGVHDVEESEEGIESEFFDGLFAWNIERNRYFPLALRKPRSKPVKAQAESRGGRKGRGQANEEDLLRNLAALNAKVSVTDLDQEDLLIKEKEELDHPIPEKEILPHFPHPRFNAQLAVKDDTLYIYGGTFEKGDREFTFDDMYAIDLGKLDGVKKIFSREPENWLGSDIEESEEESEDGSEDDSEDDGDHEPHEKSELKISRPEGNRRSKLNDRPGENIEKVPELLAVSDDISDEYAATTEDAPEDNLPRPRPFEARREFFQRTGNEWQEAFMMGLRWKGILPETLSIKEIKARAFEMCEEKWWDCREEITLLEDEQEAAGIGEVVTIADTAKSGSGLKRR